MTGGTAPGEVVTVAVLGGGHGALTTAGDLASRGFQVRLALRSRERFRQLFETGRITLEGALETQAELTEVTDDHATAARGADLVLIPLPAHAQAAMARRIAGSVTEGQVLCLAAGTFGAFVVGRELERAGAPRVPVAELATLPYGTRASGEASSRLALVAEHLPTGVYPGSATAEAVEALRPLYPAVEPVEDALSAGLLNFDGALHAPLVCMNTGPIEMLDSFDVHVQGASEGVVAVSIALDEERIALREALGYRAPHWPLRDHYENRETFYGVRGLTETRERSVWKEKLDFSHRYVVEDIGCGLALWSSLGRLLEVSTPLSDSFLAIVHSITGEDYRRTGRTLETLGLDGLAPAQLKEWIRTGKAVP